MSDDYTSVEREFNTNYVDVYVEKQEDSIGNRYNAIFDLKRNPELRKMVNNLILKPKSEILHFKYDLSISPAYFFKCTLYDEPQYPSFITKLTHEIADAIISDNGISYEYIDGGLMFLSVEYSTIQELKKILKII